ncbi:MFS transporter [Demequina sp. SYSU T00192]|uniref:MFS transporter n=1 Tax=Demequina litoralis TaxID=3051660 RepID=A0ABT8G8S0_9MICO|nr:MFS transporter [Demequina sp. SYSU T00192]MDN4475531.1 MFS transporter [Demequina sp. SYSU T00192]
MTQPPAPTTGTRAPRAAWLVLISGMALYFVAIVNRTALGVAGVAALDRFGIEAAWLSILAIAQVATYAALQLPAGALLDRWGARRLMVGGALLMAVGTGLLAVTTSLPLAILARVLIGAGDAPIFISACRLIPLWFPPRRVPVLVQVTGLVGQAGQLATSIPVAWLLHDLGWSATFAVLGAATLAVAALAVRGIRVPATSAGPERPAAPASSLRESIRLASRPAGTRLGFWTHFLSLCSANTVALLWGVPFFVSTQGLSLGEASALLMVITLTKMAAGPLAGSFTARHPLRRSWLVLGSAVATAVAWVAILVPDTPRPVWELGVLMAVIGAGGPVSLIALDYARTFGPEEAMGTATGFVNVGGFVSTILGIVLVGVTLQLVSPDGATSYTLDEYRLAFATLLIPWALGIVGVLRNRRLARADMAAAGVVVPPLREALRRLR